jgi:hypothetical protein
MFKLRYLVECAAGDGIEETIATLVPDELSRGFIPTLPDGWSEGARGKFYCPLHKVVITITVDGQPDGAQQA